MSKFFSLQHHAIYVLIAATLFGASAPLAKLLLEQMSAVSLAALAYCGGGIALVSASLIRRTHRAAGAVARRSGGWTRAEALNMTGAIVAGGVLAPVAARMAASGVKPARTSNASS